MKKSRPLVDMLKELDKDFVVEVKNIIQVWNLSKTNKQEFLNLRKYYNDNLTTLSQREKSVILYCLLTHAFNCQIAFNSKGEYNMPSGAGRSYFSSQLENKLMKYIQRKDSINIEFNCNDFYNIDLQKIIKQDNPFIYADPPYLITVGAYERDYFCKWSEDYEYKLLNRLDELNKAGCNFALSNVLEHKGKTNDILKAWSKKYNIHYLSIDYKNCNYHTKVKNANSSIEVLITNY